MKRRQLAKMRKRAFFARKLSISPANQDHLIA
jgi:hypothetical protein